MNNILATILKDTYSLSQLKHRLRILKSNLLKTFFGGITSTSEESKPTSEVTHPEDSNWLKSLPQSFYQQFNKDNVYQIFSDLEKMTTNLPILTMYLAFEPDEATLNQLGTFVRQTFNFPLLLLDIKINPNLIAGTALVWKGIYKDYSLHAKIEEKRNEISQGFKRFLR